MPGAPPNLIPMLYLALDVTTRLVYCTTYDPFLNPFLHHLPLYAYVHH